MKVLDSSGLWYMAELMGNNFNNIKQQIAQGDVNVLDYVNGPFKSGLLTTNDASVYLKKSGSTANTLSINTTFVIGGTVGLNGGYGISSYFAPRPLTTDPSTFLRRTLTFDVSTYKPWVMGPINDSTGFVIGPAVGHIGRYGQDAPVYPYFKIDASGNIYEHNELLKDKYALKTDISTAIADLVNSAPETLNTLDELASALGDDPNFATTVATELGKKANASDLNNYLPLGGGTLSGNITAPAFVTTGGTASQVVLGDGSLKAISDFGDIKGVTAGKGLSGGGTSGSVTLNVNAYNGLVVSDNSVGANLKSTTSVGTIGSSKVYGVGLDANGYLAVNVPWEDNNTTYTNGSGISISGTTISHADTNTNISGDTSYGPTADSSQVAKGSITFTVPQIQLDQFGHVKNVETRTIKVLDTDTNTHYTSKNIVGTSSTAKANASAANGNVYLNHLEESTVTSSHNIVGTGSVTVTSDANGKITINGSSSSYTHPALNTNASTAITETDEGNYAFSSTNNNLKVITGGHRDASGHISKLLYTDVSLPATAFSDTIYTHPASINGTTAVNASDGGDFAFSTSNKTLQVITGAQRDASGHISKLIYKDITLPEAAYSDTVYTHPTAGTGSIDTPSTTTTATTLLTRVKIDSSGHVTDTSAFNGSVGGTTTPVYFNAGVPTPLSYTIATSVPSGAVFTDTKVTQTERDSSNYAYPILLSELSTTGTRGVIFGSTPCINPVTHKILGIDYVQSDSSDIELIADEYVIINGTHLWPKTTSSIDIGGTNKRFKNAYFSGTVYAATSFMQSSDERLKDFGEGLKVDLDALSKLRKSYFTFKDKPEDLQIGISAQEIQKLYPEIVSETDNGYLNVDYSKLAVIALAAIDKLNEEIKELKKLINK